MINNSQLELVRNFLFSTFITRYPDFHDNTSLREVLDLISEEHNFSDVFIIDSFEKKCLSLFGNNFSALVYDNNLTRYFYMMNIFYINGAPLIFPIYNLFADTFYCKKKFGVAWSILNICSTLLDDLHKYVGDVNLGVIDIFTEIQKLFIISHEYMHLDFNNYSESKKKQHTQVVVDNLNSVFVNYKISYNEEESYTISIDEILNVLLKNPEHQVEINSVVCLTIDNVNPSILEELLCDQIAIRIVEKLRIKEYPLSTIYQSIMFSMLYLNLMKISENFADNLILFKAEENFDAHLIIRWLYANAVFNSSSFSSPITNEQKDNVFKTVDTDSYYWNYFRKYTPRIAKILKFLSQNYESYSVVEKTYREVIEIGNKVESCYEKIVKLR